MFKGIKKRFRKIAFSIVAPMIESLIEDSVKDEDLKEFVILTYTFLLGIIDLMTDDDKDNGKQIKDYLKTSLPAYIDGANEFIKSLLNA